MICDCDIVKITNYYFISFYFNKEQILLNENNNLQYILYNI